MANIAQIRISPQDRNRTGPAPTIRAALRPSHRALHQIAGLKRERDDSRRAMYEAAQLQRTLCGPRHLRSGSYEFCSEIFPVHHLSGDFISLFQIEDDLAFAIGDIAGKGLMAGIWFTHVVGSLRRQMAVLADPAAALSSVNRDLLLTGFEAPLTTLFLARVNLETGKLTYCNAGHPPPLLLRENNEFQELRAGGPILGAVFSACFVNGSARLGPGNTLLACSDGILERKNEMGMEFGAKGLLNAAWRFSGCTASMLFSVLAAVENFAESERREDDVALLVLHRYGTSKND